jgi:hypothetical protein
MNLLKVTFILFFFCFGQNIFSQKYSFKIQSQYSHYENENSEKANSKIVFLCNNEDDTTMSFFVVNDTIKNISIFDKKSRKVFFSQGGLVLDGKTNLNYIFSTCKFDLREFFYEEKTNKNVTISNDIIDGENIINIRETKKKKTIFDLYIKTVENSKYINTQNFTISMITHHRIWGIKKINTKIIKESYYLKNNVKTDIYKLDNIQDVNFEIKIN